MIIEKPLLRSMLGQNTPLTEAGNKLSQQDNKGVYGWTATTIYQTVIASGYFSKEWVIGGCDLLAVAVAADLLDPLYVSGAYVTAASDAYVTTGIVVGDLGFLFSTHALEQILGFYPFIATWLGSHGGHGRRPQALHHL
jgi:hypothetical protein